ncbi:hypothetical protein DFH08DRAFT_815060 [Mycena albidolilacea]|uniref:Uncharacterized protein n=1 Tax=Mycena albidolilacea TaxID=1033008 RepID=A0AAD7EL70_9AGAR|nr:hypothetical protein DFH08DRAFT_815060 [Mycena albidolilacea]
MRLPQELLDAIVQDIDDAPTLKACSLAGSKLREQSQRKLLRSLTLAGYNRAAMCAVLKQSPHIASYVTDLTLYIPEEDYISDPDFTVTDIEAMLAMVVNVRRCVFGGMDGSRRIWSDIPLRLSSAYSRFILSQWSLHELVITNIIELPPDMLLSLLRAAPTLTVRRVDVVDDLDVSQLPLQHVPGALRLRIGRGCLGLCRLFAYPQYASLTNGLTHLAINAANPLTQSNTHIIISNAPRTLKSLRIQMARATFTFWYNRPSLHDFPPIIHRSLMSTLDAALAAHPSSPYLKLRWQVDVRPNTQFNHGLRFDNFVYMIQEALPSAHERGRLLITREPLNVER